MKPTSDFVCTVDGKRLTETQRLRMLADEEVAALEGQFYAYHCGDCYTASLVPAPAATEAAQEAIAAPVIYAPPTYGLVRDREAATLLIAALA